MIVKKYTPEQWGRINAFIKKAKVEKRVPESYYAHTKCEIELMAWEAFGNLKAEFMSINPIVQIGYLFTHKTPEVTPTKDMRQCASRALVEVAKLGQVERGQGIIKDLGADVNYLDRQGRTPLYYAIRRKRLGMAEMLLKNGADISLRGGDSLDPFNLACAMGFPQGISLLVRHGADVNRPTPFKSWRKFHLGYQTFYAYPLAVAISQNQPKSCQVLLNTGANWDLKIRKDLTIKEFAESNYDDFTPEMKSYLNPILQKEVKEEIVSPQKTEQVVTNQDPQVAASKTKTDISVQVEAFAVQRETKVTSQTVTQKTTVVYLSNTDRIHD